MNTVDMSKHRIFSFILATLPVLTLAGDIGHGATPHLDGENLAIFWVVPFSLFFSFNVELVFCKSKSNLIISLINSIKESTSASKV